MENKKLCAAELLDKAGKQATDSKEYCMLGLSYLHKVFPGMDKSLREVPYDPAKAIAYLKMSFDLGDRKAGRYLGLCCQEGVGTKKNEQEAYAYFYAALERGDDTSALLCADYLLDGKIVPQNIERALKLCCGVGERHGHDAANAFWKLGEIYSNGKYLPRDDLAAKKYFEACVECAGTDNMELSKKAQEALQNLRDLPEKKAEANSSVSNHHNKTA